MKFNRRSLLRMLPGIAALPVVGKIAASEIPAEPKKYRCFTEIDLSGGYVESKRIEGCAITTTSHSDARLELSNWGMKVFDRNGKFIPESSFQL